MWTLWRWSKRNDAWVWETQITNEDLKRTALRNCKRRNPVGTVFKWREGADPPTRRYYKRVVKM